MTNQKAPAAGYGFNSFQEIKSHSSILYNERLAILFYLLDMRSMELNTYRSIDKIMEVRGIIKQIYKNIRCLISYNPTVRATLNLETQDPGIYITDVSIGLVDKMIEYCDVHGFTTKKVYILIDELNNIEMMLKNILQYFHYFIRPEFRQKPDVEIAVEKYKEIADNQSIEELKAIIGKSHSIDFDSLGTQRVDLTDEIEYDEAVDGEDDEEEIEEGEVK